MIGYVLVMILMGFVASYASICLKRATDNRIRPIEILQSGWLWAGGFLYVGASLLNIFLLKHLPYSVVVPLGALTYVWTMFLSHWLLHERTRHHGDPDRGGTAGTVICIIVSGASFDSKNKHI